MPTELRIGETVTLEAVARDQAGRPGYLANTFWKVDGESAVSGDPKTTHLIVSSSVADPTVIATSDAHGLVDGDRVLIDNHLGSTPALDGAHVVTVVSPTEYSIPVNVTVGGTGGSSTRANAEVVETDEGPPPDTGYEAELTGKASGSGRLRLAYDDAFLDPGAVVLDFTVLNATALEFRGGIVVDGVLLLDYQDGEGPGQVYIQTVGVDGRGDPGPTKYVLTDFVWVDEGGFLSILGGGTSQTVTIEGNASGDGTLSCTAKNSAGTTISGSIPYRVLSTSSVTLQVKVE